MSTHPTHTSRRMRKFNLDFGKFWAGQTISNLGSSFTFFALPLLVYKLTGSALNLAFVTVATFLPYLLFGLVLGAWVDRVNRKQFMIVTDVVRALVISSIPFLASIHVLSIWWIYAVTFINATLTIGFDAAQFAALASLVEPDDLVTANGRIQASFSAASIIGPLLAGLMLAVLPITAVLYGDGLSFLLSAGSLWLIRRSFNTTTSEEEGREKTHIGHDIIEGLRYVWHHPVLRAISLMMALVNLIFTTLDTQLVLFAKQQFLASDTEVGLLYAAGSAGIVLLSLSAGSLRKFWSFSFIALGTLMLAGLLTILMAVTHWYWSVLLLWALIAGFGVLFNINTTSLRQTIVPNQMLGRVMAIATVLAYSAIPIGTVIGSVALEWTKNVSLVYAAIGVLLFLIPLCFSFTAVGHAQRYLPEQKTSETSEQSDVLKDHQPSLEK